MPTSRKHRSGGKVVYVPKGRNAGETSEEKTEYKGDISFENMMKLQKEKKLDTISFNKDVTVLPDKFRPESGRKKDLDSLVEKYDINETVINMYRDKSGANDLQRMKDLGFEIQAQSLGKAQPGSAIPPRDYYYMIRTRKLTPTTDNSPKTKFTQAELNKMSRKKLESTALQVARKLASKQGISEAEAERRAKMLMSSNSDAQLRKYIKKNG